MLNEVKPGLKPTTEKAGDILINTIKEQEEEEEEEEKQTKTTVAVIKNDKETDYSKTIRHGIIHLSSYSMLNEDKRKKFEDELKNDETINNYVDEQFYTKWMKTNNPHVKAGIVYSYLYIKNLNTL